MEKLYVILVIAVGLIAIPVFLWADYDYNNDEQNVVATAAEVKQMDDNEEVWIRGKIIEKLDDERYLYRDDTGELVLEIDDDECQRFWSNADQEMLIYGEINRDEDDVTVLFEVDEIKPTKGLNDQGLNEQDLNDQDLNDQEEIEEGGFQEEVEEEFEDVF